MNIQKCCTTCKHYGPYEVLWTKCFHLEWGDRDDGSHCGLEAWEPSYKAMAENLDMFNDFIKPDEMRI